eukprot:205619_1
MGCTCGDIRNKQSSNELGLQCDPYDYDVTIEQTKSFEHNITSRQDARKYDGDSTLGNPYDYDGDSTLSDPYDYDGEPYDYPATKASKFNHDYDVNVTTDQTKSSEHNITSCPEAHKYVGTPDVREDSHYPIKADIHDHDM